MSLFLLLAKILDFILAGNIEYLGLFSANYMKVLLRGHLMHLRLKYQYLFSVLY